MTYYIKKKKNLNFVLEEEPEPKESKRPRLDFGQNIFDQLTSVLEEVTPFNSHSSKSVDAPVESLNNDGDTTIVHVADPIDEVQLLFAKKNLANLLQLNGSEILVDVCSRLPLLARYVHRCREAINGISFVLPVTLSEALTARNRLVLFYLFLFLNNILVFISALINFQL